MARLALTLFSLLAMAGIAWGQSCASRNEIISHLEQKYGEVLAYVANADNGSLMYVLVGPETWSIAFSQGPEILCLVATGKEWMEVPQPEKRGGGA